MMDRCHTRQSQILIADQDQTLPCSCHIYNYDGSGSVSHAGATDVYDGPGPDSPMQLPQMLFGALPICSCLITACNLSFSFDSLSFSLSKNPALIMIWFSFARRASLDLLAATLFLFLLFQYLSSLLFSATNCYKYKRHDHLRKLPFSFKINYFTDQC